MNEKNRRLWPGALIVLLFCFITLAQFLPVLMGHGTVSKVQQLAEWDSFFDAQRSGHSMLMDPSLVYLMIPYYLLKATMIHSGQLPLWNPYSGLGCPLAADPQALAFSPLHLPLILNPGLTAYNQVLVMEIIILGVSTFALARSLKLGLPAATFAMLAMAFCPYERWYLELLGNGYCFIPLVFWAVLSLRSHLSAIKIWLVGLACALMVLSAHPELSFFSIGLASLALLFLAAVRRRLALTMTALVCAGVTAFMLSAPMLVPFLEFLRNSDSYKFGSGAPAVVPWQTLAFNLLQPGFGGASPTLGPCVPMLLPLAFFAERKKKSLVTVIAAIIVIGLVITGKLFPLNFVLSHAPFSYLVVNYAFPSVLLLTAILAAFGLDNLIDVLKEGQSKKEGPGTDKTVSVSPFPAPAIVLSIALTAAVITFPLFARALHIPVQTADFDLCLPDYAFNKADVLRYSIFAVLAAGALLMARFKANKKTLTGAIGIILLSQTALIFCANKSMPRRPVFEYKESPILPSLRHSCSGADGRFIATGSHLLRPNSNCVFALNDLRTHNPIFPKRYLAFVKACGAHLDEFNQEFDGPLSSLLSLASVDTVLSQTAVVGAEEWQSHISDHTDKKDIVAPRMLELEPGLIVEIQKTVVDNSKKAIFAEISFKGAAARAKEISYNIALYNADGDTIWFSDKLPVHDTLDRTQFLAIPATVTKEKTALLIGLQIYDNKRSSWLKPGAGSSTELYADYKNALTKLDSAFILAAVKVQNAAPAQTETYSLTEETNGHLRLYKNSTALPRAYSVHQCKFVDSPDAALKALDDEAVKKAAKAVIENNDLTGGVAGQFKKLSTGETAGPDKIKISNWKPSEVTIDAEMKSPGLILLTNIFYPGWHCLVDGEERPLLRANYLMQSVQVPVGQHRVVFSFRPISFVIGLAMCVGALLAGAIITLRARLNRARENTTTTHQDDRKESSPE